MSKRGSLQELMDNQLIVSPQSEHGLGSESQESTQTLVLDIVFKLGHMHMHSLSSSIHTETSQWARILAKNPAITKHYTVLPS